MLIERKTGFGASKHESVEPLLIADWLLEPPDGTGNRHPSSKISITSFGGVWPNAEGLYRNGQAPVLDVHWSRLGARPLDSAGRAFVEREGAFGWPMRSMWCSFYTYFSPAEDIELQLPRKSGPESVIPLEFGRYWVERGLPLRPIVLGLTGDIAFFSFAWWFLLIGATRARRWRRRARGCCERCAYALRGLSSDRCPECGRAVPSHH